MTRILATELEGDGVKVNSACPGLVATDMGSQFGASKPVGGRRQRSRVARTLPDDGPTGGFFRDGRQISF